MAAETTVFVPQLHGGTRATNVKQTKTRGTSMLDSDTDTHTHTHTLIDFLLERHTVTRKAIVGSCLCWKRMEGAKPTSKQCNCVHVCHYTLACVHPRGHAQWKQTDCSWYHYSKHRWQEGHRDSSLIAHIYMLDECVCVFVREKEANCQSLRLKRLNCEKTFK